MSDKLKQLAGKNPNDFEPVAYSLINTPDINLFAELVEKEDFLYDFIKQNISKRLEKNCNEQNYLNLLKFLKYYSPSYEDFIIKVLVKYSDEDLTDKMLDIFENGSEEEKIYCAKYFMYVKDPLALEFLNKYAYSENSYLSNNCALALSSFGDKELYNDALNKLYSNDEFEKLTGVKFLVSYGDKNVVNEIIKTAKTSSFAENIASEIPYLVSLNEIIKNYGIDGLYILNLIISGLGEITSLSQIFDFEIYDILQNILNSGINPPKACIILNAIDKFDTLTENDEYLFEETKDTKQEIYDIKHMLSTMDKNKLINISDNELNSESLFVFTALEYTKNAVKIRELLKSVNPTVVLKSIETLKKLGNLTNLDKNTALENVSNENITNIILAI